jgi:tartrate dehydratase beta subunit/fumarate hydratase class I family protein
MTKKQPFQISGPITAQRAQAATEWMVENAARIGVAKGNRDKCENMLRVTKSLAMKASDEKSAAAQEREAYASTQYQDALDELYQATITHETLLSTRIAAQAVIEVWRSPNSTLKGTGI